jgi:hypothetical protein
MERVSLGVGDLLLSLFFLCVLLFLRFFFVPSATGVVGGKSDMAPAIASPGLGLVGKRFELDYLCLG